MILHRASECPHSTAFAVLSVKTDSVLKNELEQGQTKYSMYQATSCVGVQLPAFLQLRVSRR